MSPSREIFTIGHSNHSIEIFIELLQKQGITAVADVRSHPYSRYLPHFSKSALEVALKDAGIAYVFLGKELGARPDNTDCYVDGKAIYDRISSTEAFSQGIQRLLKGAETHKIALMCAEKDPITCHRTILVCPHLQDLDLAIHHILNTGELESHQHLEERLLVLSGLDDATVNQPVQLSLFDQPQEPDGRSRQERLQLAYHKQGEAIAYVEKNRDD